MFCQVLIFGGKMAMNHVCIQPNAATVTVANHEFCWNHSSSDEALPEPVPLEIFPLTTIGKCKAGCAPALTRTVSNDFVEFPWFTVYFSQRVSFFLSQTKHEKASSSKLKLPSLPTVKTRLVLLTGTRHCGCFFGQPPVY